MGWRLHVYLRMLAGSVAVAGAVSGCSSPLFRPVLAPPDTEPEVASPTANPTPPAEPTPEMSALRFPPPKPRAGRTVAPPAVTPDVPDSVRPFGRPIVPAPVMSVAGLSEAEVVTVLGEPQERAERGGRRIWTYLGDGCRVEVVFFRDVTQGSYAALSQKVVGADGGVGGTCARGVHSASR